MMRNNSVTFEFSNNKIRNSYYQIDEFVIFHIELGSGDEYDSPPVLIQIKNTRDESI